MFNWNLKSLDSCTTNLPHPELVKRTRILVIDDEETAFPFEILKNEGYSIDHWLDISDLSKLERGFYDIVILDIGGIGQKLDEDKEGIAVLEHIKRVNPSQIVIAHSGQSYKSSKIPFFNLADQFVPKPTPALKWKEILDNVISTQISVSHYWESIKLLLSKEGATEKQIRKFEKIIIQAGNGKNTDIHKYIEGIIGSQNIANIICLVVKLIELYPKGD
ncbi:MAG: response regulator transcription factor [Planctomycetes bacterium]|nr:response regulator transcription factor [Planctomycetota bacterium]